ncbi:Uncharacterized protein BM_BM7779 [Brugia malayi]|uniref:Bm7779 n=1 Tax=Brugia malayi TaxID=6279 RepID=A0A0H5RZ24_BRUMA|nr:Uncharacterized protein BM_BM7779 [Brugia malayi]CRZ21744.1 Bm7779 [Brugia malayi]VIO94782.1 Uncharacterized protein BM_BM7779 [Brugia malayi]
MIVLNYRFVMIKIDICIFLFALIATFAYACGPSPNGGLKPDGGAKPSGGDGGKGDERRVVVTDVPGVVTDAAGGATEAADEVESTTAEESDRKKREIEAEEEEQKCKSAEVIITTDETESPDGALETVKKLEAEIKSVQDKFAKTIRRIKLKTSGGGDKLKLKFAVDAECDTTRHFILDTLFKLKTIQSAKVKCECEPPVYLSKNDFSTVLMKGFKKELKKAVKKGKKEIGKKMELL